MTGARLCMLLGKLGFEGHSMLDPDSFEWPFQYDDARPILHWLCSNLRPSNVLSPSEVSQLARHQFLKIACQMEKKTMLGAYSLLKIIESELQSYLLSTKGRVVCCQALTQAASDVQEQGAVDDRDSFLHGVTDLLSIYSNAQTSVSTYVSAPGIFQQISSLQSDLMTLQSDLENMLIEDRNRCINELCTLVKSLQQLLFASSTTALPLLTPRQLTKEFDEMEKINARLSAAIEGVNFEHYKKNEIVKHHASEVRVPKACFC